MAAGQRSVAPPPARPPSLPARLLRVVALVAGLAAIGIGAFLLAAPVRAIGGVAQIAVGRTPVTVYLPAGPERGPAVVVAHGFAGSQQIMEAFALALARGGYRVVSFDFPGHGRSAVPLRDGDDREARSRQLAAALDDVVRYAQARFGGPVGLLGHSMGSDAVARYAANRPEIAATVGVSLVYRGVTPERPRNLLVLTGAWEPGLIPVAQAVADGAAGGAGATGVTYGSFAEGTARRVVLVPWVEHVAVLFSPVSLEESYRWFSAAMPLEAAGAGEPDVAAVVRRVPALGLIFTGAVLLFWPLAALVQPIGPLVAARRVLSRRAWWAVALVPAALTPLLLLVVPSRGLLPILVGGPLALFFGLYGLLSLAGLAVAFAMGQRDGERTGERLGRRAGRWRRGVMMSLAVALLAVGYVFLAFGLPAQLALLNYFPPPVRLPVFLAVLAAMLPYFLADEALTRRPEAPRGAYAITKLCFVLALAAAIALDPGALAFLLLVAPIFVLYFAAYGLLSWLIWRRTGTVLPGALANSVIFAWIVAAVFPLVA
jgi:pimeloyl-ACP methyl ester carboxylesterase